MRQTKRLKLDAKISTYLAKKQAEVDAGRDVEETWKYARKTKKLAAVAGVLATMAGERERCMFCLDSRGVDIEHFWPKAVYHRRVFKWLNLLLVCSGCNRRKGDRFKFRKRRPLLINPTAENPWKFLFFEPLTGNLAARVDPATGEEDPRGLHTTDPEVLGLNDDPVTHGRRRVWRNLKRAVENARRRLQNGDPVQDVTDEVVSAVKDSDDYGLAEWFFVEEGQNEQPFSLLKAGHAAVWDQVVLAIRG